MRLGLFPGRFDPPHLGHLALARAARDEAALDAVLWIPTDAPAHKTIERSTRHRTRLVRALIAGEERMAASSREAGRGRIYTVDALAEASRAGRELFLILGADAAAALPTWRDPARIVALADLLIGRRSGLDVGTTLDAAVPGWRERGRILGSDLPQVSATEIRERLVRGEPVDELTGERVATLLARERRPARARAL